MYKSVKAKSFEVTKLSSFQRRGKNCNFVLIKKEEKPKSKEKIKKMKRSQNDSRYFWCLKRVRLVGCVAKSRLPDDATARPSGLNEVVNTDEMSGDVLFIDVELEVKQKLVVPLLVLVQLLLLLLLLLLFWLTAYTLPGVSALADVDGEPDDFGVKSKGVDVVPSTAAASAAVGCDVSSSSIVDNVGDGLRLLRGDSCSLQYSGLSVARLKPVGDFIPFKSLQLTVVAPFENLLHKFTNDWVMVTMAMCEDIVVTVLTWFSSAASDVVNAADGLSPSSTRLPALLFSPSPVSQPSLSSDSLLLLLLLLLPCCCGAADTPPGTRDGGSVLKPGTN
jgi:hypothetical protein